MEDKNIDKNMKDNYIPKNEDIAFISSKIDAKIDMLGEKIENLIVILCQLHGKEVEIDTDGKISIKKNSISNISNNSFSSQKSRKIKKRPKAPRGKAYARSKSFNKKM